MSFDPIGTVEAAYDYRSDERAWLDEICRQVSRLDHVKGAYAYAYSVEPGVGVNVQTYTACAVPPDFVARIVQSLADFPPVAAVHSIPGSIVAEATDPKEMIGDENWVEWKTRILDGGQFPSQGGVVMQTWEPQLQRGFVVLGLVDELSRYPQLSSQAELVGCHLAAGFRLREQEALPKLLDDAEAVFEGDGRLRHAAGEASEECDDLQEIVKRLDRVRARHVDPAEGLQMWEALARGRWSLVDVFDTDRRRYVVAVRNHRALEDPRALTELERRVTLGAALGRTDKLIGYEEGLPRPTVAAHLRSAMRKLGVSKRVELITMLHRFADVATHRDSGDPTSD